MDFNSESDQQVETVYDKEYKKRVKKMKLASRECPSFSGSFPQIEKENGNGLDKTSF
ncbi:hypothetical protein [Neobacillus vireti]|uniref:hypothetical protein n=1 Tax=Neobacillus vireti TaxID=220686 RepID=UPI002FFD7A5F